MKQTALILFSTIFSPILEAALFTNPNFGFSVEYPETWEVAPLKKDEQKTVPGGGETLASLQRKVADEKYHSRFSVVLDPLGGEGDQAKRFEVYRKKAVDFLKGQRFTIRHEGPVVLPHVKEPAYEILAYQRDFGLTFHQVLFPRDDKVYLLTAAARTAQYENQKADLTKILQSFQFRGN